jgi:general secretion pathway protein B
MSYILEALKKADAAREREREVVPGLHSHHAHALPDEANEAPASRTPWLIAGVAGGVVIAGAMFWLMGRTPDSALPPSAAQPAPLNSRVGEPVSPAKAPQPIVSTTSPRTPTLTPADRIESPGVSITPKPVAAASHTITQQPLRVDPALPDGAPQIMAMQELPDDIRRELPQLSVGGAMHSDVAANRMLILNGGVFREGDQPVPGVMLEEIRLKSAVLRYNGHRYSISY